MVISGKEEGRERYKWTIGRVQWPILISTIEPTIYKKESLLAAYQLAVLNVIVWRGQQQWKGRERDMMWGGSKTSTTALCF